MTDDTELPVDVVTEGSEVVRLDGIVGKSSAMQRVYDLIRRAAAVDLPVLLAGETGVGKELAALAIHRASSRRHEPFIAVNTGGLSQTLAASSLFGHEKGAFTGADGARKGRFEDAEGGTLFLDEIGTMGRNAQVSLLRVLETNTFRRVGGSDLLTANVRIVAATNQKLRDLVQKGTFLDSLLYRFEVLRIHLPPLRERDGDVELLAQWFVRNFAPELGSDVTGISPDALELLRRYHWHGNVRELRNVIQQAIVLTRSGRVMTVESLPERLRTSPRPAAEHARPADLVALSQRGPSADGTKSSAAPPHESDDEDAEDVVPIPLGMSLADAQKVLIAKTLDKVGGNKARAARILGISRKSLYSRIAQLRIESDSSSN